MLTNSLRRATSIATKPAQIRVRMQRNQLAR